MEGPHENFFQIILNYFQIKSAASLMKILKFPKKTYIKISATLGGHVYFHRMTYTQVDQRNISAILLSNWSRDC